MPQYKELRSWYQWEHWVNTPQVICVLLSVPICWVAAIITMLWPTETKPLYLTSAPLFFFLTPLLAFLVFVRGGMAQVKPYSSSLFTTMIVMTTSGLPFFRPVYSLDRLLKNILLIMMTSQIIQPMRPPTARAWVGCWRRDQS